MSYKSRGKSNLLKARFSIQQHTLMVHCKINLNSRDRNAEAVDGPSFHLHRYSTQSQKLHEQKPAIQHYQPLCDTWLVEIISTVDLRQTFFSLTLWSEIWVSWQDTCQLAGDGYIICPHSRPSRKSYYRYFVCFFDATGLLSLTITCLALTANSLWFYFLLLLELLFLSTLLCEFRYYLSFVFCFYFLFKMYWKAILVGLAGLSTGVV